MTTLDYSKLNMDEKSILKQCYERGAIKVRRGSKNFQRCVKLSDKGWLWGTTLGETVTFMMGRDVSIAYEVATQQPAPSEPAPIALHVDDALKNAEVVCFCRHGNYPDQCDECNPHTPAEAAAPADDLAPRRAAEQPEPYLTDDTMYPEYPQFKNVALDETGKAYAIEQPASEPEAVAAINGIPVNSEGEVIAVVTRIAEKYALGHVLSELEAQNAALRRERDALAARVKKLEAQAHIHKDRQGYAEEQYALEHENGAILYRALSKHLTADVIREVTAKLHTTHELDKLESGMARALKEANARANAAVEALRPFAKALSHYEDFGLKWEDTANIEIEQIASEDFTHYISVGDLRRAARIAHQGSGESA